MYQCFRDFIQFLLMGSNNSSKTLKIASLNYSGIIASPYEFYDSLADKSYELNQQFETNCQKYFKLSENGQVNKDFAWTFMTIDKHWHSRFSPMYKWDAGIKSNKLLMDEKQFYLEWLDVFNRKEEQDKIFADFEKNCHEKNKTFDNYLSDQIMKKQFPQIRKQRSEVLPHIKHILGENTIDYKKLLGNYSWISQQAANFPSIQNKLQYVFSELMLFDYLIYKTIVQSIEKQINQPEEKKKEKLVSEAYRKKRKSIFNKPYLKEEEKIRQTLKLIDQYQIDIFFIQEATKKLIGAIQSSKPDFRIVHPLKDSNQWSIIAIRDTKFGKLNSLRFENRIFFNNIQKMGPDSTETYKIKLDELAKWNINGDTVVQAIGNIILVGTHLSSKSKNNKKQLQEVKQLYNKLCKYFPEAIIIVGGDLNGNFVEIMQKNDYKSYSLFPQDIEHFTTHKKRSSMQAQWNKSYHKLENKNLQEKMKQDKPKDYIMSNRELKNRKVLTIGSERCIHTQMPPEQEKPLIPNSEHLFDHYLVIAEIDFEPDEIVYIGDQKYKYNYDPEGMTQDELIEYEKGLPQS